MSPNGLIALVIITVVLGIWVIVCEIRLWNAKDDLKMYRGDYLSSNIWFKSLKTLTHTTAKHTVSKRLLKASPFGISANDCLMLLRKAASKCGLIMKVITTEAKISNKIIRLSLSRIKKLIKERRN